MLQDHMFQPDATWSLPAHLFLVSGWRTLPNWLTSGQTSTSPSHLALPCCRHPTIPSFNRGRSKWPICRGNPHRRRPDLGPRTA